MWLGSGRHDEIVQITAVCLNKFVNCKNIFLLEFLMIIFHINWCALVSLLDAWRVS